jgi:hypothetical protein
MLYILHDVGCSYFMSMDFWRSNLPFTIFARIHTGSS